MATRPYPNLVKDSTGKSDTVQPVAVIGYYGDAAGAMPISEPATQFEAASVVLTANQAAGTAPAILADPNRSSLKIVPPADCTLRLTAGGPGIPLFGGVPNDFVGRACPMGDLFISGLAQGAAVTVWEG